MLSKNLVAIPSPFPWAPGHVVLESEYMLQYQILNNVHDKINLVFLPGPVSIPFVNVYRDWFKKFNINLTTDIDEATSLLAEIDTSSLINAALSHCVHVLEDRFQPLTRIYDNTVNSSYSALSKGRLQQATVSTQYVHNLNNDFCCNYYSLPASFKPIPRVRLGLIEKYIPDIAERKIILTNIREHRANASAGMNFADFLPLIKYLQSQDYSVVDVSHEKKSFSSALEENGVFCYSKLEEKNFYLDIDLFSYAKFYIGGGGISHLAYSMKIPSIWVGGLFPIHVPSLHGFILPCQLYDRGSGLPVDTNTAFREYLGVRNPWEPGYDCWSNSWGKGNPFNCYETLNSKFIIEKPTPLSLLNTFICLENNVLSDIRLMEVYKSNDIFGRPYIGSKVSLPT